MYSAARFRPPYSAPFSRVALHARSRRPSLFTIGGKRCGSTARECAGEGALNRSQRPRQPATSLLCDPTRQNNYPGIVPDWNTSLISASISRAPPCRSSNSHQLLCHQFRSCATVLAYVHSVLLLVHPVLVEAAAPRRHAQGLLLQHQQVVPGARPNRCRYRVLHSTRRPTIAAMPNNTFTH